MTKKLFCFGLGYSALALAHRLESDGWNVCGTTRSGDEGDTPQRDDFRVYLFDGRRVDDDVLSALHQADAVLVSTPPDEQGDPVLGAASHHLRNLTPHWLGYLSTTGIYGDRHGEWVDETTTPAPSSPRSERRLAAETAWQSLAAETGLALHIFRLPGIYGPGRNPLDALRAGTARRFDKPGQVFSRIHVEDLASALAASIAKPSTGSIYNICDDEPASQADVIAYGATLLGLEPPPLERFSEAEADLSEMARSFYRDSKRVCNTRMKQQLGVLLAYPTYRKGLTSLLRAK